MKNIITVLLIVFTVIACKAQNDSIRSLMKNIKDPKRIVSVEAVQKAIETNLDSIKMLDYDYIGIKRFAALTTNPTVQKTYYYDYFSEKAKERMVELFEGKWTEEEIESRINASIKSTLDTLNQYNGYYKDAKKIAKRDSLPLLRVWDSMIVARKKEWGEDLLKSKYVDYQVISIAGYLKDPRFLPYLKNMDNGNYVSKEVELALARYGEEPYYSNAIKKYGYGQRFRSYYISKLKYICSKDAIEEIYKFVMNDEEEICDSHGNCQGYIVEFGAGALYSLFKNEDMKNELKTLEIDYARNYKKQDKAYLKKVRAITKRYYKQFKDQEPDCENVPVNAW